MNWKQYKALPSAQKQDETYYIIGLDIGNESSGIAFYNLHENEPEPIDLSGGYGKPSIPTMMQYIPETKEWVFGEYAILNQGSGTEITLSSLVNRLGSFDYIEVGTKTITLSAILGLFIKELIASVYNINPKAEVVGIVAAISEKLGPDGQEELKRAFKAAGYEKELIALVPTRECILAQHYRSRPQKDENILILDYGSREVRGGVYAITASEASQIEATALSSLFNEEMATGQIWEDVYRLFESYYLANTNHMTPETRQQLTAFTYQHKDILFQKNIRIKPAKLYYNFVYPPFQQAIAHADAERLAARHKQNFGRLIAKTLEKNISARPILPQDINAVLCIGGGFEMLWAREAVEAVFGDTQIHMYRNAKLQAAQGAAFVAAVMLGAVDGHTFQIRDTHQLPGDIGIKSGSEFLPLAEGSAYWWQNHQPRLILVNDKVDGELGLSIAQRTPKGERVIASHTLTGLPKRPKGTTRLKIGVDFKSDTRMTLSVTDIGFGELFPKTDYRQDLMIQLA